MENMIMNNNTQAIARLVDVPQDLNILVVPRTRLQCQEKRPCIFSRSDRQHRLQFCVKIINERETEDIIYQYKSQ